MHTIAWFITLPMNDSTGADTAKLPFDILTTCGELSYDWETGPLYIRVRVKP